MTLMCYEPLTLLNQLQRDINWPFAYNHHSSEGNEPVRANWTPAIDIQEEENSFSIHADLPGVDIKDIEITMENNVLVLKGQRSIRKEEESHNYRRVERVSGTFLRRFSLPDTVDAEKITAKCKDGVLELFVPKRNTVKPRRITIEA
ncbi:MAG: heat-shock protein Hsp20 [Candidatus Contendobacter odensis]|uniref:Heat-shock protein Hsp20 n=1 Tax=Candidatus Contendibacter odensensis TaxID=1400860 RepID=A0A2G6PDV1_9GAMM|nr:MAG: heat-shock protein Hsp20 [Candidatus Contendobacter odensis]